MTYYNFCCFQCNSSSGTHYHPTSDCVTVSLPISVTWKPTCTILHSYPTPTSASVSADSLALYKCCYYYAPAQGALSDDAVWRLSVWRLARTSGRRVAFVAGKLDGAYWLIGPGSAGLAQGCRCTLLLQAWAGAYHGGCLPTRIIIYYYYYYYYH